ncbi:uncharacterized protein LOC126659951 [Mercurialis annua]|uniref:uncharacterized protein LOC126659951 n=1 Tax=Mercurialis annua TaxID=3986 RepID=UPI0024AE90BC|nr:uncharacterized protein LOC126659951 [Mercurialis annua]
MNDHMVYVFYGGFFVKETGLEARQLYVGGEILDIKVTDVGKITLNYIEATAKKLLLHRELVKIHYKLPESSLSHGLRFLYEGSFGDFIHSLKSNKRMEIFIEHKIPTAMNDDSTKSGATKSQRKDDNDIFDITLDDCGPILTCLVNANTEKEIKDSDKNEKENVGLVFGVTNTQSSLIEEINAILGSLGKGNCEEIEDEVLGTIPEELLSGKNIFIEQEEGERVPYHVENNWDGQKATDHEVGQEEDAENIENIMLQHVEDLNVGSEDVNLENGEDPYLIDCEWLSDDDEELQEARNAVKESNRRKIRIGDVMVNEPPRQASALPPFQRDEEDDTNENELDSDDEWSAMSTDGSDCDHAVRRKSRFPVFDSKAEKINICLGMIFKGPGEFKEVVTRFSIQEKRDLKLVRNTSDQVRFKCKEKFCPFVLYASKEKANSAFMVKTFMEGHTCGITSTNRRVTGTWLAHNYLNKYHCIAAMKVTDLIKLVKTDLKVDISFTQMRRAKVKTIKIVEGDVFEEFGLLWDYLGEIGRSNSENTVAMEVHRPIPTQLPIFERLYISFDCLKKGFLGGCRKIFGLDGCYLRGLVKGEILAAVGRDGNNQMFPIAWSVVTKENYANWEWFIKMLIKDLDLKDGDGWTLVTDQQKGLLDAVGTLLPKAEHRCCARHLHANWRKEHKGKPLQKQFWICAKSNNMPDFEQNMKELKKLTPKGFEAILRTHPRHWCRAYFNTEVKCDIVDNNLIESFNGQIVDARSKNVLSMLEDIRKLVMNRLRKNRDTCDKWICDFGPRIRKKLYESCLGSTSCHLLDSGNNAFEIEYKGDTYAVDLRKRTCPCRGWDLTGIPCVHAVCAIQHQGKNPEDFVHSYFGKERYMQAYSSMMSPMNSKKFWKKTGNDPPQPPPDRRMPGRPAKKRRMEEHELRNGHKLSRNGRIMTCQRCYQVGHNRTTCKYVKENNSYQANHPNLPEKVVNESQPIESQQDHSLENSVRSHSTTFVNNFVASPLSKHSYSKASESVMQPKLIPYSKKRKVCYDVAVKGQKPISNLQVRHPCGYGVQTDEYNVITVNPRTTAENVIITGKRRSGKEPEPSFMTSKTGGFKKWGKKFITSNQLQGAKERAIGKKKDKGKDKYISEESTAQQKQSKEKN